MSLSVAFHRAATTEFIDASEWYENKRIGLGREFILEIERCVMLAAKHPRHYAIIHKDIRRVIASRFPYSVYFRHEEHRILVLAVFHSKRNPNVWQTRI